MSSNQIVFRTEGHEFQFTPPITELNKIVAALWGRCLSTNKVVSSFLQYYIDGLKLKIPRRLFPVEADGQYTANEGVKQLDLLVFLFFF